LIIRYGDNMIENKRCPWCGNVLKHDSNSFKIDRYAIKCLICHNWSRPRMNIFLFVLVLLLLIISLLWDYLNFPIICFLIVSLAILLYIYKLPYKRISNGKWDKRIEEDVFIGGAQIKWYSKQEGGLILAKYRILNHYIMPICFYDDEKNPVTHTLCVRLESISRVKRGEYNVFALADSVNIDAINDNKNFYVFNKKKIIAEGKLL